MGDLYSELLVKRDKTAKDSLTKYGLIVLTALAAFAGLFINPIILIVAIALGIACYFVIPKTDVEYEYLFINGDFDIDMVMAKTKRKRVKKHGMDRTQRTARKSARPLPGDPRGKDHRQCNARAYRAEPLHGSLQFHGQRPTGRPLSCAYGNRLQR